MDSISFLMALVTLSLVWGLYYRNTDRQARAAIARLEAKLDLLLKNVGLTNNDPYANLPLGVVNALREGNQCDDPSRDLPPGVVDALREGNKIEAIKCYRQATGEDLKTSKEFVEEVQRRLNLGV
jgi:ribosomal protein L7/L12